MITSRSVSSFHCVALITIDETELRRKQGMDGDDCIAQFDMLGIVQGNNPTRSDMSDLGVATIEVMAQVAHWRSTLKRSSTSS